MNEVKEALKTSIEHWKRMRAAAVTFPPSHFQNTEAMCDRCGEIWYCDFCALCYLFHNSKKICPECPLYKAGEWCEKAGSLWSNVDHSKTWREWIENADKLIAKLKELYDAEAGA